MIKTLDWHAKKRIAFNLENEQLFGAIADCIKCVRNNIDSGYYSDEASVYRAELTRRGVSIEDQDKKIKIRLDK